MVIKILTGLGKRVKDLSETLNRDGKQKKKNQSEMNNSITEIKNTLDGINSRLKEAEEWISNLGDKAMELIQTEQQKEKNNFKK